eukprot:7624559-Alexandrium_andersonii.AAC.1
MRVEGKCTVEPHKQTHKHTHDCRMQHHDSVDARACMMLVCSGRPARGTKLSGGKLLSKRPLGLQPRRGYWNSQDGARGVGPVPVSYTHLRAHETSAHL